LRGSARAELRLVEALEYVPFNREAAKLLFEFFSDRNETRAVLMGLQQQAERLLTDRKGNPFSGPATRER